MWLPVLLLTEAVVTQNATTEKPCIAFSPESASPTNTFARDPLERAGMLSGDFDLYASQHDGCWNVLVLSLPIVQRVSPWGMPFPTRLLTPRESKLGTL